MNERDLKQQLQYTYYEDIEDGRTAEAIDYESARDIIVEKYPNRKVIAVIRK